MGSPSGSQDCSVPGSTGVSWRVIPEKQVLQTTHLKDGQAVSIPRPWPLAVSDDDLAERSEQVRRDALADLNRVFFRAGGGGLDQGPPQRQRGRHRAAGALVRT